MMVYATMTAAMLVIPAAADAQCNAAVQEAQCAEAHALHAQADASREFAERHVAHLRAANALRLCGAVDAAKDALGTASALLKANIEQAHPDMVKQQALATQLVAMGPHCVSARERKN